MFEPIDSAAATALAVAGVVVGVSLLRGLILDMQCRNLSSQKSATLFGAIAI